MSGPVGTDLLDLLTRFKPEKKPFSPTAVDGKVFAVTFSRPSSKISASYGGESQGQFPSYGHWFAPTRRKPIAMKRMPR
jgi:hypothetical protein